MPARRENGAPYVPKKKVRKQAPVSQGHPSQGAPTVGGGTGGKKPTRYKSPTPTPTPGSQGHPSQGAPTVGGGTKARPRVYKSPTPSLARQRKQRLREARQERRNMRRARRRSELLRDFVNEPAREIAPKAYDRSESHDFDEFDKRLKKYSPETRKIATRNLNEGNASDLIDPIGKGASKVLDQITRGADVTLGAANEIAKKVKRNPARALDPKSLITDPDVAKAAYKSGVTREKRVGGDEFLGTLGVPKGKARRIAGAGVEIVVDPITWVPGLNASKIGSAGRAITKGRRAADRVAPKTQGVVHGATPAARKQARKERSYASRQAYTKSYNSRRSRAQRSVRVAPEARDKASRLTTVRPTSLSETERRALQVLDRRRRGTELAESRRSARKARAVRRAAKGKRRIRGPFQGHMSNEQSRRIRAAMEANDLSGLSRAEQRAAHLMRSETERLHSAERAASIEAGERVPARYQPRTAEEPPGYVPRVRTAEVADEGVRKAIRKRGQKIPKSMPRDSRAVTSRIRTTSQKTVERQNRQPYDEVMENDPNVYVDDLEASLAAKGQKSWRTVARTEYRDAVRSMGRRVSPKAKIRRDEGVYIVKDVGQGRRFVEVTDPDQLARIANAGTDQAVILRRAIADHANEAIASSHRIPILDPTTNAVKWVLTIPNPQYWMRNAYGGLMNVWLSGVPARKLPGAIVSAARVNRSIAKSARREEGGRTVRRRVKGERTVEGKVREQGDTLRTTEDRQIMLAEQELAQARRQEATQRDIMLDQARERTRPPGSMQEAIRIARDKGWKNWTLKRENGIEYIINSRSGSRVAIRGHDMEARTARAAVRRKEFREQGRQAQRDLDAAQARKEARLFGDEPGETMYHGTDPDTAAAVTKAGGFGNQRRDTVWTGEREVAIGYGPEVLTLRANPKNPIHSDDPTYFDLTNGTRSIAERNQVLREAGYDAIVVPRPGGGPRAILALDKSIVKTPRVTTEDGRLVSRHPAPEPQEPRQIRELGDKTIKLGKAGKVKVRSLIHELERANVSGGGQTQELIGAVLSPRHVAQSMEDLPRITAYIHARRIGMSPDEASRFVQKSQFDYGQLTAFEKNVARRIFPFYTWRSRNIHFQAKQFLTRPGKYATIEKLRDAARDVSGLPDDWEEKLTKGEAMQFPIPIPIMDENDQPTLLYTALPITDLNLLTGDPGFAVQSALGMVNPVVKNPIEFATNYSFYWKDNIERNRNRYVAAPDKIIRLIEDMALPVKEGLEKSGIIQYDPEKKQWQWRGRADYLEQMTPLSSIMGLGAGGQSVRGQKFLEKAVGFTTGVRPGPYRPLYNATQKLYDKSEKINNRLDDMSELHQDKKGGRYTKEQAKLRTELNKVLWQIYDNRKRMGEEPEKPNTTRGKTYSEGYDPEHPTRGGSDDGPIWAQPKDSGPPAMWERKQKRQPAIWE